MPFDLPIDDILDDSERSVVADVVGALDALPGKRGAPGRWHIEQSVERLLALWEAVERFPHLRDQQTLGRRRRNLATLLDTFSRAEPYSLEAYLPTRASLARAYGMAKFNFCRMLGYVVRDQLSESPERAQLQSSIDAVSRAAVAAVIGEDVLRSIACDSSNELDLRRRAASILAALWDQRATQSLRDFAPILDSAWRAKGRVCICYGTLSGVSELFQLITAGVDQAFIDYFGSDRLPQEQYAAFEEFVFNATHEEIRQMRQYMDDHGHGALDPEVVARIFGVEPTCLHTRTERPEDMFFTFREREMWARTRRLRRLEGPTKTAEAYVMIYVLSRTSAQNGINLDGDHTADDIVDPSSLE